MEIGVRCQGERRGAMIERMTRVKHYPQAVSGYWIFATTREAASWQTLLYDERDDERDDERAYEHALIVRCFDPFRCLRTTMHRK